MKYIDTSAFAKYYGKPKFEGGIDKVLEILRDVEKGKTKLIASIIILGEGVSTFDRWLRINYITKEELNLMIKRYLSEIKDFSNAGDMVLVSIGNDAITESLEYITRYHISLNDAIHLYTAIAHFDEIDEFICSDANLIKAAKSEGFKVLNPEEI